MIAETLALLLVLGAPASRPAATRDAGADNGTRARRGLLPRKAARRRPPAVRGRRIVLLPAAPTWLGEPSGFPDPDRSAGPLVEAAAAALPEEREAAPAPLRAAIEGADVAMVLLRRTPPAAGGHLGLRAELQGVEVGAVLLRRVQRDPR